MLIAVSLMFFFFNDTATTEIYTLSLHDALPICVQVRAAALNHHELWSLRGVGLTEEQLPMILGCDASGVTDDGTEVVVHAVDRKSTRLNSSHANISYAVFCLKKKKKEDTHIIYS